MPVEVIDLLSSPSDSSPPAVNNNKASKRAATPPRRPAGPSRALGYNVLDLTAESPKRLTANLPTTISNPLIPGIKRTNSGRHRQDDDFLFLSDDPDTNSDLGDSFVTKKRPRVSPSSPRSKKNGDSSFRRTASAVVASSSRDLLQPVGMKRWNSLADPIEHSSSPRNTSAIGHHKAADVDWLDSVGDHRGKQTKTETTGGSRLPELSSDPFGSSPIGSPKAQQTKSRDALGKSSARTGDLLPGQHAGSNKPSKKTSFIDLSSDPFDTPLDKLQSKDARKPVAWDPISSSMPDIGASGRPFSSLPPSPSARDRDTIDIDDLTDSDSDDLPDLADIDFSKIKKTRHSYSVSPAKNSKLKSTSKSKPRSKPTSKLEKKTAEEKEAEKKKRAEQREVEKERKRVQKEQEKEQRTLENVRKKALEDVNKIRTDKKISTPEMIVDLPSSLNPGLMLQIQELLKDIDVEHGTWHSMVDNVVKWRRKVTCQFNEELGHWEPMAMHVKPEDYVLVIVEAAEFVKLALGAEGHDLEAHVLRMKTSHPDATIIYLIEGLMPWMRKNRNVRNRQFQSAVRNEADLQEPAAAAATATSRRRNAQQQQTYIDEDSVEDALLTLQVLHGALIHHTHLARETAQWVAVFTQHISTVPYRRAREAATAAAGFCMDAGQVRAGDDPRDVYVRMLQEMTRVTAPIAHGIAAEHGSVARLVRGLEAAGPLALEACRKSANRDGAFTDRAVGPAVSKRIYKVFTGTDPLSTDV